MWAGRRQHHLTNLHARHPHHFPDPDHRTPSSNDYENNMFTQSTTRITDALYHGLQYPEEWIYIYNRIMRSNAHTPVQIPTDILDASRRKYFQANTTHNLQSPPPHLLIFPILMNSPLSPLICLILLPRIPILPIHPFSPPLLALLP